MVMDTIGEIPRDRWGRPMILPPSADPGAKLIPYTRTTTFVDSIEDKWMLQKWMQRMVAIGLATDPALRIQAASLAVDPEANKAQLDELCNKARTVAGADDKATVGTALHKLTEIIDRGGVVDADVAGEYAPHLDAYRHATAGFTYHLIEEFVVLDDWQVGGTPDRLVTIPGESGKLIMDLKTGPGTLKFGALKVAMQMAVYAHSERYSPDGTRTPLDARQDLGVVVALDSTTAECELYWIDLVAGWEAAKLSGLVRQCRAQTANLTQRFVPDALSVAIAGCRTLEEGRELWSRNQAHWTDAHTHALKKLLEG